VRGYGGATGARGGGGGGFVRGSTGAQGATAIRWCTGRGPGFNVFDGFHVGGEPRHRRDGCIPAPWSGVGATGSTVWRLCSVLCKDLSDGIDRVFDGGNWSRQVRLARSRLPPGVDGASVASDGMLPAGASTSATLERVLPELTGSTGPRSQLERRVQLVDPEPRVCPRSDGAGPVPQSDRRLGVDRSHWRYRRD